MALMEMIHTGPPLSAAQPSSPNQPSPEQVVALKINTPFKSSTVLRDLREGNPTITTAHTQATMNSTPRMRRPPPRLRTKTGCFMCRRRRKKCDEQKPRCIDCSKHNLKCVWPASPSTTMSSHTVQSSIIVPIFPEITDTLPQPQDDIEKILIFRDDSTQIGLARSAVFSIPQIGTSVEHHLSFSSRQKFIQNLLRGNVHPAFGDFRLLMIMSAKNSTLMDTILAATAAYAAYSNPKLKLLAVHYYNSVISRVRRMILSDEVKGDEDWLVLTTNLLCLFESIGDRDFTQPSAIASHLEGLARILSIRGAMGQKSNHRRTAPFWRTCSESLVYHLCNGALYHSGVDRVADCFDWDDLSLYLEHEFIPGANPYEFSPLLGYSWKLYRINFELVCLSHLVPLSPKALANGRALELELLERDETLRQNIADSPNDVRMNYLMRQTHLYVLAAQILAFKILRPETTSHHPRIKELVNEIVEVVRNIKVTTQFCAYFGWPIAIASCAITKHRHMLLFHEMFEKIWENSHCGDILRTAKVMKILWRLFGIGETDRPSLEDDGEDILNVLISGRGLFENPLLRQKVLR